MARPLRIEYAGACYHVINRGVERRRIFGVDRDYEKFLRFCHMLGNRYAVSLYAYCLMPNHYHLLIRTRKANLREFMQELNGQYSQHYNRRCGRVGPLFQGRYKGVVVQAEEYGTRVARYIHMNPVKASLVDRPEDYRWSSYRAYVEKGRAWLVDTDFLYGFYRGTQAMKREAFRRETVEGANGEYDPEKRLRGGVIAGSDKFREWLKGKAIPRRRQSRVSHWGELQHPGDGICELLMRRVRKLTDDGKMRRKLLAYALRKGTGMHLKEIGKMVGMKTTHAVSKTVHRLEEGRKTDAALDRVLGKLDAQIRAGQ
jgi:REP element-mobilizing transposase RayT